MESIRDALLNAFTSGKNAVENAIGNIMKNDEGQKLTGEEVHRQLKETAEGFADGANEIAEEAKIAVKDAKEKMSEVANDLSEVAKKSATEAKVKAAEITTEAKKESVRGTSYVSKAFKSMFK